MLRTPVRLTCSVRLLVALNQQSGEVWPLMLPTLVCSAFFCAQALRAFLGTHQQASRVTNWWLGKFQSGCLSFGSLLATVRRQSAIRHRLVAVRPSAASAPWCRGKPQHLASRSHGHWPSLLGVLQLLRHLAGCRPQVLVNRPAYRRSASIRRLARCAGVRQNCFQSKGVLACQVQTSVSKARLACSHRLFLLAPA